MGENKFFNIERLALQQVPKDQRQHWIAVTLFQAGYMVSVASLWSGSVMVEGMTLMNSLIAGILGYAAIVLICIIIGMQGVDLGVPAIVTTTSCFGEKGSRWLISSILILTTIGWFAINANICGAAFAGLLSESFGIEIPVQVSIIAWGIVMVSTAAYGFNGIKRLNAIAVPFMITACFYGMYLALSTSGVAGLNSYVPQGSMSMVEGIAFIIGGYALGGVIAADCTRYQRSRKDVVLSSVLGIFPLGVAFLLIGAVLAVVAGTEDLTIIYVSLGIPVLGLVSLILSTWPSNAGNAYSAGLDVVKMFNLEDAKRAKATLVCGLIGTIIGSFEVIFYFETIITYFGIIVVPIGGVMIADYWIVGKGKAENWKPKQGWDIAGLVAFIGGSAIALTINWGVQCINGLFISMILYIVLIKFFKAVPVDTGSAAE